MSSSLTTTSQASNASTIIREKLFKEKVRQLYQKQSKAVGVLATSAHLIPLCSAEDKKEIAQEARKMGIKKPEYLLPMLKLRHKNHLRWLRASLWGPTLVTFLAVNPMKIDTPQKFIPSLFGATLSAFSELMLRVRQDCTTKHLNELVQHFPKPKPKL